MADPEKKGSSGWMSCIKPPKPGKVRKLKEESFIRKGKGRLRVVIENGRDRLETIINGSLKSVGEMAEMLGVEVAEGKNRGSHRRG